MGFKEDIDALDGKISMLKVEYEQYFLRVIKREPLQHRDEIERLILLYSNKSITNTSLKFRFNTIVSKYTAYKQYWMRVLREIEEGTYLRRAEAEMKTSVQAPEGAADGRGLLSEAPRNERAPGAEARPPAPPSPAPSGGNGGLKEAYKEYLDARTKCKEKTNGLSFDSFVKTVEKTKQKVEEMYKTKDVELKIYVQDGQTKITITPKGK